MKVIHGKGQQDITNITSGIYGSTPILSGAGVKTAKCHSFEAWEDTVISNFKNEAGVTVVTGWENIPILATQLVYFGEQISEFTVTTGGQGQAYKYEV